MANALVAADLDLAADIGGYLAAQVTFNLEVAVDVIAQLDEVVVAEVTCAQVGADPGGGQCLASSGTAYAVDVRERDLHPLLAGEVNAGKSCHAGGSPGLFVEGVLRIRSHPAWDGLRPSTGGGPATPRCAGWSTPVGALGCSVSALALLVTQVLADDHDPTVATDDLALVADRLDARLDLHGRAPSSCSTGWWRFIGSGEFRF